MQPAWFLAGQVLKLCVQKYIIIILSYISPVSLQYIYFQALHWITLKSVNNENTLKRIKNATSKFES